MTINGTVDNDHLPGTTGSDDFDVSQGGDDQVNCLGGDDQIRFGAEYTAEDIVFGGAGADAILLEGDYSKGPRFQDNIVSVEQISMLGAFNYTLRFQDNAVAAGRLINIDGGTMTAGHRFTLNGQAETDGRFFVTGSLGKDVIRTGAGNDEVFGGDGDDTINPGAGTDRVSGGDGEDIFFFTGTLDPLDQVDGGAGFDNTIELSGDYSGGLVFRKATLTDIDVLHLAPGNDYTLDFATNHAAPKGLLIINGEDLGASDSLVFTATGIAGAFSVNGGAGVDTMLGAKVNNSFRGNGGGDQMTGGAAYDTFIYEAVSDSRGPNYDTIFNFDTHFDFVDLEFAGPGGHVDGVDTTILGGHLDANHINADLAARLPSAGELDANHAVLFRPNSGTLAGEWFLIVDGNGTAGYQANHELVIHLVTPRHLSELTEGNFGTPG